MGVRVVRRRVKTQRQRRREAERKAAGSVKVPNRELTRDVKLLNALTKMKLEQVGLDRAIERDVRAARRAGASWARIGDALGITHQAAAKRWGPYPEKKPRVERYRGGGEHQSRPPEAGVRQALDVVSVIGSDVSVDAREGVFKAL